MKERWNRIRTGFFLIVFMAVGVWEYVQLMQFFDIPQVMLVMPVVGMLSFIALHRLSWFVPLGTIVLSCLFQISSGEANAVAYLQTNAASVFKIILYVLPVCIVFEVLGIGAGVLVCVLINRKKKMVVGIFCAVLGLAVTFGPYLFIYHNPLYPLLARIELNRCADSTYTDYGISSKQIYFDLNTSDYRCRVIMTDGVVREVTSDEIK
jgi:uncharacterized membrane protein